MQIKKIIRLSFLLVFVLFFTANSVYAADFRIADKNNGNVHVGQDEKISNLYTAGNVVLIDADIQKGLHAAGNVVTISGDVGGTVYSGAGTLLINGDIGGSVHGGGGSVVINGKIADDLFVGGGNVVVSRSASIGDDLFIGGGTIDIQGSVSGDAYMGGGTITINGEIQGNVKIDSADKIKLGSNAKINGNLEYNSKNEIEIEEGAVVLGEMIVIAKKGLSDTDSGKGIALSIIFAIISLAILIKIGSLIAVGFILIYLFRNITENVVKESLTNFWKNLGTGLVFLLVIPIMTIILLVTVVGIWLGIIVGILYVLLILLAVSFASITFGSWAIGAIRKDKNPSINWKVVVGGVVVLAIIKLIPIIGGIVFSIFMLIGLGAICRLAYGIRKSY